MAATDPAASLSSPAPTHTTPASPSLSPRTVVGGRKPPAGNASSTKGKAVELDTPSPSSPSPARRSATPTSASSQPAAGAGGDLFGATPLASSSALDGAESPPASSSVQTRLYDPLGLAPFLRHGLNKRALLAEYPGLAKHPRRLRRMVKFYARQNELINSYLGANDEERMQAAEEVHTGPRVKLAVRGSVAANFCLLVIQLYAAISTRSLALFATAADAFMDLASSLVMLVTSHLASKPSVYKYPVGRTRIETMGVILFCALMTTMAIELMIESSRSLADGKPNDKDALKTLPLICVGIAIGAKSVMMTYCFFYRRFPSVHVFFLDHRNDIFVNTFGLVMSIVGQRYVWYLDPLGAILIALLIMYSWISNAFEQVWMLVGKSAPGEYLSKIIYMAMTHDRRILKLETCRAYHAGQNYYVEVDIVMDEREPLRVTHDVSQTLQRKLEGLSDVERAFVHVDFETEHDINEEHKPPFEKQKEKRTPLDKLLRTNRGE